MGEMVASWLRVAWLALGLLVLLIFLQQGFLHDLLRRTKRFAGFGFEVEFNYTESSAGATKTTVEETLEGIRRTIVRGLGDEVRARGLRETVASIIEGIDLGPKYRVVLHIPDPLFADRLYQAIDYIPAGGGEHRTFSARTGLIGLAWRARTHMVAHYPDGVTRDELVSRWGMSPDEADRRLQHPKSLLAVVLRDPTASDYLGILYLDSDEPGQFGLDGLVVGPPPWATRQLVELVLEAYREKAAETLKEIVQDARRRGPQIVLERV